MLAFLLLILGLVGLWLGAELTIRGALNIAQHYKISEAFIGLTVLAIGTGLPELFIVTTAAIDRLGGVETSGVVVGEVIGTSLSQVTLMIGIAALVAPLAISKRLLYRDGGLMVASAFILLLIGWDGRISPLDGGILLFIYIAYFFVLYREEAVYSKVHRAVTMHRYWAMLSVAGGLAVLLVSSSLTLNNALTLSDRFGVSQSLIGLLLVGLGTSFPELATSISAARRQAGAMAVANLVGSNIYNVFFTVGVGAVISGFRFPSDLLFFDLPVLLFFSIIALIAFRTNLKIRRREGIFLILLYVAYVGWKLTELAIVT
jgi:cation:H+ antiporter